MQKAYFAAGCFWGVQYYFQNELGVISSTVGYMGGEKENPSYEDVSHKQTGLPDEAGKAKAGHAETLEITFDETKISYEDLAKLFFEIHDFSQVNGQGPDIGEQYRSEIFYTDESQKNVAEKLIKILVDKKYKVATKLTKAEKFWPAEEYHQKYYEKNGDTPYCHIRTKKF